jgi:hypothetical protein
MAAVLFVAICAIKLFPPLVLTPLEGSMSSKMLSSAWLTQKKPPVQAMMRRESTSTMIADDCQQRARLSPPRQVNLTLPTPPPPPRRINMTLRRGHLTKNLYNKKFSCERPLPLFNNRMRQMHPSMKNTPGVLDFTTFLSTDLKILVMGDSVGMQVSQTLEEVLGANPKHRKVYRYSGGDREGLHVSAPIHGGGVVAGWRMIDMLLQKNLNGAMPIEGPGWKMEDVHKITHHQYNTTSNQSAVDDYNYTKSGGKQQQQQLEEPTTTTQVITIGSFDVLLFHIPIGWIRDRDSINSSTLLETVLLAGELFGVETVVFTVPSFTNNIMTAQHLQSLRAAQNRVVQFAKDFVPNLAMNTPAATNTTVRHVLVLRMDQLMDQTMEWNARLMGMNVTTAAETTTTKNSSVNENDDWRLVSLVPAKGRNMNHSHHVAQTCSALPSPDTPTTCTPNYFSHDGMHVCMEKMGGRIFAGLGCVLGCVYNYNHHDITADDRPPAVECQQQQQQLSVESSPATTTALDHEKDHVLSCANACNDRYLSLRSVENEVVE